jgi:hypothetical protein
MTFQQISQRGKEYSKTAETLLQAVQAMTDRASRVSFVPGPGELAAAWAPRARERPRRRLAIASRG